MQYYSCLVLLICSSCSPENKEQDIISFHYNISNKVTSLDPAFARNRDNIWVVDHLYSTLVQFDDDMHIVPDLAKKWEIDPLGLTYTFTLREGVTFHEHTAYSEPKTVTAADVAYSLGRLIDTTVNSPGSWVLKGKLRDTDPFETPNDSTFILHLNKPFPPMLGILTMQYCSVLNDEFVAYHNGKIRDQASGTGPFQLAAWKEDQGLFLKKNAKYHFQNASNLENVRISFISDRKTALMDLLSGHLDLVVGMDPSFKAILLDKNGLVQKQHRHRIKMIKSPFLNTEYLGINLEKAKMENSPLADRRFRQALNYGLDKELMMSSLRSGVGKPALQGFIPFGMIGHDSEAHGFAYDPKKARQLLDSTDYFPEATTLKLQVNSDYLDLCLFAASQWQKLGVNVEVELIESSLLRQMMRNGASTFFRASWIGDYPDEETFLTVFYGSNPAPPNYTRFHNAHFDSLYEHALRLNEPEDRLSIYRQMDSTLIAEAPVIFLYYDESLMLSTTGVSGISTNAFNLLRLDSIRQRQY